MEDMKLLPKTSTPAPVLVVQFSADRLGEYQKMARALRAEGIGVEVFPEAKKVGQQLQYADKRGFKVALIAGPDDFAKGIWLIKDLRAARKEGEKGEPVQEANLVARVREMLRGER
jgi:histidyl-tRNA synthetase